MLGHDFVRLHASSCGVIQLRRIASFRLGAESDRIARNTARRRGRIELRFVGFKSPAALAEHYRKHKPYLRDVNSEVEYLSRAQVFMLGPKPSRVMECVAESGDTLRFDILTQEYGVLSRNGYISTYHIRTGPPRDALWFKKKCRNT